MQRIIQSLVQQLLVEKQSIHKVDTTGQELQKDPSCLPENLIKKSPCVRHVCLVHFSTTVSFEHFPFLISYFSPIFKGCVSLHWLPFLLQRAKSVSLNIFSILLVYVAKPSGNKKNSVEFSSNFENQCSQTMMFIF